MKYVHTNIISDDWKRLAQFYIEVFHCSPVHPERDLSGEWLEKGTSVPDAHIRGIHLRLPGYSDQAPTLEIFQYDRNAEALPAIPNRKGIGHLAFLVDDVEETRRCVMSYGGQPVGEVVQHRVEGAGLLTFTYVKDPEGNIIELQRWEE